MKRHIGFLLACFLLLHGQRLAAQEVLSPNAPAEHGGAALGAGFNPDPLPIAGILAGGGVDIGTLSMGTDCRGYVTAQPDFRLNIVYPFAFLRFIFVSDSLLNDTTLIVRSPGGSYRCSDDSFNVDNPSLDYRTLVMGEYSIWVGARAPNSTPQGTLYLTVSEAVYPSSTGLVMPIGVPVVTPTPGGVILPTAAPGTVMDADAAPIHGSALLEHGFLPDPYWSVVIGGGVLPVPPHDLVAPSTAVETQCAGYATSAPQLEIQWRGLSTRLRMFFIPAQPADIDMGLVISSPQGWACSRQFAPGFVDPMVEFINPAEGNYRVWITHEAAPNEWVSGVLYVTEKEYYPTFVPEIATASVATLNGPDPNLPSEQGTVDLNPLLISETYGVDLVAGGEVDLRGTNPGLDTRLGCLGFIGSAPDLTFSLNESGTFLRLFFLGQTDDVDGTLVVRAPDGQWYCNDDSYNDVHPTVNLIGAVSGSYLVWVGNFDGADAVSGRLYFTQNDISPLTVIDAAATVVP